MSDTSLTKEFEIAADKYNMDIHDMEKITINAMKSAFIHHDKKLKIIYDVIKKGYKDIREEYGIE
jgi:adenosine deaminase